MKSAISNYKNTVPKVRLNNGLVVANFSSPHPFTFDDGWTLAACSPERASALMLEAKETVVQNPGGWQDIHIGFRMSYEVFLAIAALRDVEADVVLVPLVVRQAAEELIDCVMGGQIGPYSLEEAYNFPAEAVGYLDDFCAQFKRLRTIRCKDRVTKVNYSDRFCM